MIRLLVVNPNSTVSMTAGIERAAVAASSSGTHIVASTSVGSPPAIQGAADGEAAVPHMVAAIEAGLSAQAIDAVVIACFDDTGLIETRDRFDVPVYGIGECAYHLAMLRGARFSVVTTLAASVPVIEHNIIQYGFASRCARVYASNIPVLELEAQPEASFETLSHVVYRAVYDGCDAIVLGCAGMADVADRLERKHQVPVIDGVAAAVKLAESVTQLSASA